jgi:nicotinate phosphoribosyltransferase
VARIAPYQQSARRAEPLVLTLAAVPPERLSPDVFRLPVDRIRAGYYSDAYFNFTKELLEREDKRAHVLMQVFQKKPSLLGGIDEAIAVLKLCSGDWDALEVHARW